MSKSKITLSGGEALLGAAFLFALTNVLVREMAFMWGDQAQVAVRFALVWIILTGWAYFRKSKHTIPRSKLPIAISYSVVASLAILFFTLSVQMTTIANTLFMSNAAEMVVGFLLGTLILKENLNRRKFIAIGLSLAGLAIYGDSLFAGNAGLIFGALAGTTTALCNLLAKKLKGVDLNAILRMQFGVGTLFMIVLMFVFSPNDIIRTVNLQAIIATVLFAFILILATRLILYGFQHFDVNIATVVLSSQLAFGALLGFFIYKEVPAPHEIISGVLIACAAVIGSIGYKPSKNSIDYRPS